VRIAEPAADLAILVAILSSVRNRPLPPKLVVFGEVGLAGEIRPVQGGQERLREAAKLGFGSAIIPRANDPRSGTIEGLRTHPVARVSDVLDALWQAE
jgi:DNA repair protein RadA/Sms